MSDFDIEPRHKRALDELDWAEQHAREDCDEPDTRVFLIVTPESGPGMANGQPIVVQCNDREQAEQILFGLHRQSPEDHVEVAVNFLTGDGVIEDWFAQADAQMGDPNP